MVAHNLAADTQGAWSAGESGGWSLRIYQDVASTQDLALEAARAGAAAPLAILAHRQAAGRGRAGRMWESPEGNLYLSALLRPAATDPPPGAWSLLAGLAVYETAFSDAPAASLMLKWPNDLLLGGAKLAGILIDSALSAGGQLEWIVIGVGVNLAAAPRLPDRDTTCLAAYGRDVSPHDFACGVLGRIDHWRAAGFGAVRAAWLARAHPPGTPLRVQRGGQVIEGAFLGLTEQGALRLAGATDTVSGEVEITGVPA